MTKPLLSLVIPVFNSRDIVAPLHKRISECLDALGFELILVNDGSTDGSWQAIETLCNADSRVRGIDLRNNFGQDNAIMAGLAHARGEFVVIMDDDLQHDPADIPRLLEHCRNGYDVVYACFKQWKQSALRRAGSRFNGGMAGWLLGKPAGLYLSPFKIMRAELCKDILSFTGPYPYVDGIILSLSPRLGQILTPHHPRHSGKSNYTLRRSAGVWFRLFTGFSVAPLRLAALLGFIIALTGVVLSLYYLWEYFFTSRAIEGWATIVLLLLFFGGLILMVLGLIGAYIGRIYITLNGTPQYSIRATAGGKGD